MPVLSPAKASVAMAEANTNRCLPSPRENARQRFCRFAGVSERLVLKVRKLLRDGKDLKIVRSRGLNVKKWTITAIRHDAAAVARDLRKFIRKLAAEHKMDVNMMKSIFDDDLGLHRRAELGTDHRKMT